MADHSLYLEENASDIVQVPGFPYLRLSPALVNHEDPNRLSPFEEQLLFAMHCPGGKLLVVSNKHVRIYKLPPKKSFLQKAVSFGVDVGIGSIPVLGESLDAIEKLKRPAEWVWNTATRKKAKERREDEARAAEGLPTKSELEDLVWDVKDRDTLMLILLYREKILLRNGFGWKKEFEAPLPKAATEPMEVSVDAKGISFLIGRKKVQAAYAGKDWAPLKIAEALMDTNRQALEAAGWSVEIGDKKFALKNVPMVH
jgi:hypothetical protein